MLREIPGTEHNPVILNWLYKLKAWWRDDETPWCGLFVASCFNELGYPIARTWMRARAWLDWGIVLHFPTVGCVVVFERQGGGHVGFVVGRDVDNNLMVLGGNQGNKVSIAPFSLDRVLGYRWPNNTVLSIVDKLPIVDSNGIVSANEA
jgi:uncharacterized protein (TIGR02594 family)